MEKPALLLVEDSEDDAFFFNRTFQKSGTDWLVHHVVDGSAAIEFLRSASNSNSLPQIIFLDLKMPLLNGFDVLSWLQRQTFCSSTTVVVLSGSDNEVDKERTLQLGAKDYLVKPVTVTDFQRLLGRINSDRIEPATLQNGGSS